MSLAIGDSAPAFDLPDTHDLRHGPQAGAAATVIVFTCNHCPYALAWHDRLAAVAGDYAGRGVQMLLINSNDAVRHPRDSFDAMKRRVEEDPAAFPMPYLHDATQEVARAYDARTTPDVFLLGPDGRLAYRGAPDGDSDDPAQNAAWLRAALDDVLEGRPVRNPQTEPVGCSIKWKA